uniref:Secreted protein n=1 Tax=Steinernema glaseri TaxID=37863 RepID=A0A1I8A534_9BILA
MWLLLDHLLLLLPLIDVFPRQVDTQVHLAHSSHAFPQSHTFFLDARLGNHGTFRVALFGGASDQRTFVRPNGNALSSSTSVIAPPLSCQQLQDDTERSFCPLEHISADRRRLDSIL